MCSLCKENPQCLCLGSILKDLHVTKRTEKLMDILCIEECGEAAGVTQMSESWYFYFAKWRKGMLRRMGWSLAGNKMQFYSLQSCSV